MWKVLYWSAWMVKRFSPDSVGASLDRRTAAQFIEHAGKRQPIDGQDWILGIHDVEADGPGTCPQRPSRSFECS